MSLQKNMSEFMRIAKAQKNLSMEELSKELDISKSTLQTYLSGEGNPGLEMVEHIAKCLDVDPIFLLSGQWNAELRESVYFSRMFCRLKAMSADDRQEFQELFSRLLELWMKAVPG